MGLIMRKKRKKPVKLPPKCKDKGTAVSAEGSGEGKSRSKMPGKLWMYSPNGQKEDDLESEADDYGGVKWWYWKSDIRTNCIQQSLADPVGSRLAVKKDIPDVCVPSQRKGDMGYLDTNL